MKKSLLIILITAVFSFSCSRGDGGTSKDPNAVTIDFYSINDYHGRVESESISHNREGGISRFATYLKKQVAKNPDNSVFVNAGDLWQDTYDSALNRGELLTKAMVELNCEAMALGNHEFDWGTDVIKHNKEVAETYDENHEFTFLGANIYNFEGGRVTTHADELCSEYKIIERSGIKIGLIGGIGTNQLTSITSSNWENITFVNPVEIVKNLSDKLRTELDCRAVVYLYHGPLDDSSYVELSKYSPVTGEHYIDAGFLGHSHQFEGTIQNGVPWVQAYQHGAELGHIRLEIGKNIECSYYSYYDNRYENGYGDGANSIYAQQEDADMKALVNTYLTSEFVSERESVVGTIVNSNRGKVGKEVGGMLAYITNAHIDELRAENPQIPDIDIVINNGNRDEITLGSGGEATKENIFNLIPFTNKTIIAEVKGKDIITECIRYSNPYYLPGEVSLRIEAEEVYTVACIDYLLLHKDTSRSYNYFTTYDENPIYTIEQYPYELVWDYLCEYGSYDLAIQGSDAFRGLYQ